MEKAGELDPRRLNTQTPLGGGETLVAIGPEEYRPIAQEFADEIERKWRERLEVVSAEEIPAE